MNFLPLFFPFVLWEERGHFTQRGRGKEQRAKVPYCSRRRTGKKRKKGRGVESKKKHWIIGYVFFL